MKYGLTIAGAAVALLAVAVGLRLGRDSAEPVPVPPQPVEAPAAVPAPAVAPPSPRPPLIPPDLPEWKGAPDTASPTALAARITLLLLEVEETRERYRVASKPVSKEERILLQSLQTDARNLAEILKERLRVDPTAWREITPLLASFGQAKNPLKVMDLIAPAADEPTEAYLADLLAQGDANPRSARRLALVVMKRRTSPGSLTSLMEAARQDPDALVRYEALQALRSRAIRPGSDPSDPMIMEFIRGRAKADPDEQVRTSAHRLTPEGVPKPPPRRESNRDPFKRPVLKKKPR